MELARDSNLAAAPVAVPAALGRKLSLSAGTALLVTLPTSPKPKVVAVYADSQCVLRFGDSSVVAADSDGAFHAIVPAQAKQEYAIQGDWTHISLLSSVAATVYLEYF